MTASPYANIVRPDILALEGYSSAWSDAGGQSYPINISANENPWPPFGALGSVGPANRYAAPQPPELRQRLAELYGVSPKQILITRGSDEGIDLLCRLTCRAGEDSILVCPPAFGMYEVYAGIQGAKIARVPLVEKDGWQMDLPKMKALAKEKLPPKLVFATSPHAPLGHFLREADVPALCEAFSGKALVVSDEAYIEFTGRPEGQRALLAKHNNLVILRTLSKAHGMAGERIGCVIAAPELIALLGKIMAAYPLTQTSIRAAMDALSPAGLVLSAERRRILVAERERLAAGLAKGPDIERVFPSVANFLLVEAKDADALMAKLKQHGILARAKIKGMPKAVRIAVGAPEENDLLLKILGVDEKRNAPASKERIFAQQRVTKETRVDVVVNLDRPDFLSVSTGIGFFDHMLQQVAAHGGFGLVLLCKGDLEIDQHHTVEDCALTLGAALRNALGDKRGIGRYGFTAPLDEALASAVVDLSGRPYVVVEAKFPSAAVGELQTEMVPHFFRSLGESMGAAIHIEAKGENTHHMVEASFKALGRALRQAFAREGSDVLPSTKGVL